jgi:hypothetical protein
METQPMLVSQALKLHSKNTRVLKGYQDEPQKRFLD